jgi:hypothetical protein
MRPDVFITCFFIFAAGRGLLTLPLLLSPFFFFPTRTLNMRRIRNRAGEDLSRLTSWGGKKHSAKTCSMKVRVVPEARKCEWFLKLDCGQFVQQGLQLHVKDSRCSPCTGAYLRTGILNIVPTKIQCIHLICSCARGSFLAGSWNAEAAVTVTTGNCFCKNRTVNYYY